MWRRLPRNLITTLPHRSTVISGGREKDRAALGEYNCTRVFGGRDNGAPDSFPKRSKYLGCPRTSKLTRPGIQLLVTKTFVMMRCPKGPQSCTCLGLTSLLPDFNSFADSVVLGLVCRLSSPESRFCSCLTVPSLFFDLRTFVESAARGIDCIASSTVSWFVHPSRAASLSSKFFLNVFSMST